MSTVYIHVVEDVISKVRDEFINNGGPGETVLNELQGVKILLSFPFYSIFFLNKKLGFVFVILEKHLFSGFFVGLYLIWLKH